VRPPRGRGRLLIPAKTATGYARRCKHRRAKLMSSAIAIFARGLRALAVLVLAAAVLLWLGARSPAARAADPGALKQQISAGQNRVSALSGVVGSDNGRLRQLDAGIAGLQRKIARIQSDLDAKRAELLRLRGELNAARVRLARLTTFERTGKAVLSHQLVAGYETPQPDLVSVVLNAHGFTDLLERLSFARRIRTQDQQIIAAVILARDRVAAQAVRLDELEGRQQDVTARVLAERGQIDAAKLRLLTEQMSVTRARDKNVSQLATARGQVASLGRQLARLRAEQAQQAKQAAASQVIPGGVRPVATGGNRAGSDPIPGFVIGRDDMGVDATASPGAGIYAPLASHLVQVLQDWYGSEPLLLFQFDAPPPVAPSDYWYVAEQIDPVTTALGTGFQAGQRVASYASSGTGIEIGWGSATSDTRTLAGATDPAAASPLSGSTAWGESFKSAFGIS
jgi:peptidoglycan hydrolase CwlO-like protein